jgi:hypothetical protein
MSLQGPELAAERGAEQIDPEIRRNTKKYEELIYRQGASDAS